MTEPNPQSHPVAASHAELRAQAAELRLHGLLAHWEESMGQHETEQRVRQWLGWESAERAHRSLERRLREAHLGRFKPLAVGGCESTRKSGCEAALLMDEVGESVPMALFRWPPAVLVG